MDAYTLSCFFLAAALYAYEVSGGSSRLIELSCEDNLGFEQSTVRDDQVFTGRSIGKMFRMWLDGTNWF